MVWQKKILAFQDFFTLFVPSLINWIVPAFIMSFAIPKTRPAECAIYAHFLINGKWFEIFR